MPSYSEFIDRLLLRPELLLSLQPDRSLDALAVAKLRETEPEILGTSYPLIRGALLYALDALEPAHHIFQEEISDLGSYWHGMLHRREGDFDNARYWFRRAGMLPFFSKLHRAVAEFSGLMGRQANWDPYLFTGECEQASRRSDEVEKLPEIQKAEFAAVFDYSWRQATIAR